MEVGSDLSMDHRTFLVATHNKGKVKEYRELLEDLDASWVGLNDVGIDWDVEETGTTFEENAGLKATSYARASGILTLADDSGLEVDALGGEPGVYTARFGGAGLTSEERYQLLLQKLRGSSAPRAFAVWWRWRTRTVCWPRQTAPSRAASR